MATALLETRMILKLDLSEQEVNILVQAVKCYIPTHDETPERKERRIALSQILNYAICGID